MHTIIRTVRDLSITAAALAVVVYCIVAVLPA